MASSSRCSSASTTPEVTDLGDVSGAMTAGTYASVSTVISRSRATDPGADIKPMSGRADETRRRRPHVVIASEERRRASWPSGAATADAAATPPFALEDALAALEAGDTQRHGQCSGLNDASAG